MNFCLYSKKDTTFIRKNEKKKKKKSKSSLVEIEKKSKRKFSIILERNLNSYVFVVREDQRNSKESNKKPDV